MKRFVFNEVAQCSSVVCHDIDVNYIKDYIEHYDLSYDCCIPICCSVTAYDFVFKRQSDPRHSDFGKQVLEMVIDKNFEIDKSVLDIINDLFK